MHPVLKIVSGGQAGVDRAALDAALACGLPIGGWGAGNVRDPDATLIVTLGRLDSGSKLTADIARRTGRPCIVASLESDPRRIALAEILPMGRPEVVLNVAGPRESRRPGIYARAFGFLVTVFRAYEKAGFELKLTATPPAAAAKRPERATSRLVLREPSAPTLRSLF